MPENNPRLLQVLSPYGNWKHSKGLQIVDKSSGEKMRERFNSTLSKLLGAKIPIYIGHPDDNPSQRLPKPIGYIRQILQTEDGIAVECEYDDEIYQDIVSGKYKALSPRWEMKYIHAGTYTPVRLISAGLTNNPNIPESGKILKAINTDFSNVAAVCSEALESSKQRCQNILQKAQKCLISAKRNATEIKNKAIETRIENHSANNESGSLKKISSADLSEMARERSKSLGEPYSRSFAILRRQYKCN